MDENAKVKEVAYVYNKEDVFAINKEDENAKNYEDATDESYEDETFIEVFYNTMEKFDRLCFYCHSPTTTTTPKIKQPKLSLG